MNKWMKINNYGIPELLILNPEDIYEPYLNYILNRKFVHYAIFEPKLLLVYLGTAFLLFCCGCCFTCKTIFYRKNHQKEE